MSLTWRGVLGLRSSPPAAPESAAITATLVRWSDVDPNVCFLAPGRRAGARPGQEYVWAARVTFELPRPDRPFPSLGSAPDVWMRVIVDDVDVRWCRARVVYRAPGIFRNLAWAGEESQVLAERGLEWSPWFPAYPPGGRERQLRPIVGTVLTLQEGAR